MFRSGCVGESVLSSTASWRGSAGTSSEIGFSYHSSTRTTPSENKLLSHAPNSTSSVSEFEPDPPCLNVLRIRGFSTNGIRWILPSVAHWGRCRKKKYQMIPIYRAVTRCREDALRRQQGLQLSVADLSWEDVEVLVWNARYCFLWVFWVLRWYISTEYILPFPVEHLQSVNWDTFSSIFHLPTEISSFLLFWLGYNI